MPIVATRNSSHIFAFRLSRHTHNPAATYRKYITSVSSPLKMRVACPKLPDSIHILGNGAKNPITNARGMNLTMSLTFVN
jgi:hypothetical protein